MDGVWEGEGFGRAAGHAAIRELFAGFRRNVKFSHHLVMNPRLEVQDDVARGVWQFLGAFAFREPREARWIALRYTDDCARVDGADRKFKAPRSAVLIRGTTRV